jgi:hypothetical protein
MKIAIVLGLLAACAGPADVPPLGDYTTWKRIDTYGETAGHGDTYRIIYANDIAVSPGPVIRPQDGQLGYTDGTTLVKEIHDNVDNTPGALQLVEISRVIGDRNSDQEHWVFTTMSAPGATEHEGTTCWRRCHQAAPYTGAWFDFSK